MAKVFLGVKAPIVLFSYEYDRVAKELSGKSVFSTDLADNVVPMPAGLQWSADADVSKYDWSGISIAVDIPGQARDTVSCCTLIAEQYACSNGYCPIGIGDTIYWLNSEGNEVIRSVVSKEIFGENEVALYGLSAPVIAGIDKVKAYKIITNPEEMSGRINVSLSQSRKFVVSRITAIDDNRMVHGQLWGDSETLTDNRTFVPGLDWNGEVLTDGDRCKPQLIIYQGEPVVLVAGNHCAYDNVPVGKYFSVMNATAGAMQSLDFTPALYWPRQGNTKTFGMGVVNATNTWEWFMTSTDRSVGDWWSGNPTPTEIAQTYGRFFLHNPGGFGPKYPPMDYRQWDWAIAHAAEDPIQRIPLPEGDEWGDWDTDEDIRERCNAVEFTKWCSVFSQSYRLAIYYGQPQTLEPNLGETPAEWVVRARASLQPVLDIRPKPLICLDYVVGQGTEFETDPGEKDWVNDPLLNWAVLGGNDGGIALLYAQLEAEGYELMHEPWTIEADYATWCRGNGELIFNSTREEQESTGWQMSGGKDLTPQVEMEGRRVVLLNEMSRYDPPAMKSALVKSVQDEGFDIATTTTNGYDGNPVWTLVTVPDIQAYTGLPYNNQYLIDTVNWIIANKDTYKIAHVAFLGDLTAYNIDADWQAAKNAISLLDNVLPYTLCVGNHDEAITIEDDPSIPSLFPNYFQKSDNPLNEANGMVEFNPGKYYQGSYQKWIEPTTGADEAQAGTNDLTTMTTRLKGEDGYWVGRELEWTTGALDGVKRVVQTSTLSGSNNILTFLTTGPDGGPHLGPVGQDSGDRFEIQNGRKILMMNTDYWPDEFASYFPEWTGSQVEWAKSVAEANPDYSILHVAHSVLDEATNAAGETVGIRSSTTQKDLFNNQTNRYPNIQVVFGGHTLDKGDDDVLPGPMANIRQLTDGQEYNKFNEIVFNTQELDNGGEGMLRLYQFMDDGVTLRASTYSVLLDQWYEDDRQKFDVRLDNVAIQRTLNNEPSLRCLLQFNETTGEQAFDSSPGEHRWRTNFYPGSYENDDHWISAGKFDRGIRVGRPGNVGPWLERENDPDLTGTTYTVALWFKAQANPTNGDNFIVRKVGVSPDFYREYLINLNTDGTLTFSTSGTGGLASVTGTTPITLDIWQHVAMTCDGSAFQGYLNGSAEGAPGDVTGDKITELTDIGTNVNEPQLFGSSDGIAVDLDDFRYYQRQLSGPEVAILASDPYLEV